MSNLIIFDLDGVITSEEAYWDAAGLTVHELMYSPRYWNLGAGQQQPAHDYHPVSTAEETRHLSRATLPEAEILSFKARALNSNWDTSYVAVCLRLIHLLASLPETTLTTLLPLRPWDAEWLAIFRERLHADYPVWSAIWQPQGLPPAYLPRRQNLEIIRAQRLITTFQELFDAPPFQNYLGLDLINRFDVYATKLLGVPIEGVFSRLSPLWSFCRDIFQEWYLGDTLYTGTYGHPPAQTGKPGCMYFEKPLLPVEQMRQALETLCQQRYILGFATGRNRLEATHPLEMYSLLRYFDEQHLAPYDYVEQAEADLRTTGNQALLGKPHPFQFLVALDHAYSHNAQAAAVQEAEPANFIVVGDSPSDMLGGRAAGALTVAVLTGARTAEARSRLEQSSPDFTIADITHLPALLADMDSLATIQRLQFTAKETAERLLQRWLARHMHVQAEQVTLTPKPVSLNSFNGVYRVQGEEFFFKTHVEEQSALHEYYHAELLANVGYNIVRPLRTIHEEGRQMVVYPVVRWPVMFDLVRSVEKGMAHIPTEMLVQAEREECAHLLMLYQSMFARSTTGDHAQAPIHQLFWHRLAGGRLNSFYAGKSILLHGTEQHISFEDLRECHWVINGVEQMHTLGELIERAKVVLHPSRAGATVIGHGDAHFGNVFLEYAPSENGGASSVDNLPRYLYFDPAFGGRHSPLLDIIKPLFHNIFATWMYFPAEIERELQLSLALRGKTIIVEHTYRLTSIRQVLLQTKVEYLLTPLVSWLRSVDALPGDWLEMMELALLCCPLLTVNLFNSQRFPSAIGWLGLLLAVQMGNDGIKSWRNDG